MDRDELRSLVYALSVDDIVTIYKVLWEAERDYLDLDSPSNRAAHNLMDMLEMEMADRGERDKLVKEWP